MAFVAMQPARVKQMPVRLDELPRETQRQVLAALEEQGQLVVDSPDGPIARSGSTALRKAGIVVFYGALAVGLCFLAFVQPSAAQGYPEFFAGVVAYVVRELLAIVRENAVPLSGNLVIVVIFALGVWQAARLALWIVRKLWPVLVALAGVAVAVAILRLGATQ
jgi:hypothetical protein